LECLRIGGFIMEKRCQLCGCFIKNGLCENRECGNHYIKTTQKGSEKNGRQTKSN
jgi:hypothetical protein